MGFIYLIHVREFLHKNECVYKIGRTDHLLQRITQYPKGSKLLFCMNVNDNRLAERDLLNILARQYKIRVDIGAEYIEGALDSILQTMFNYIQSHNAGVCDAQTTTGDAIVSRKVDPSILIMDFINGRKGELAGKIVKSRELYDQLQQWLCDNDHHVFISHVKMSRELTRLYGVEHKVHRFHTGVEQAICFATLTCTKDPATVIAEIQMENNKLKSFIAEENNDEWSMEFSCKRCGYSTCSKGNLVKHFKRKATCQPLHSDQSYEALLLELNAKTFIGHNVCT